MTIQDEEQEIKWISAIRVLLSASRKANPALSSPAMSSPPVQQPQQQQQQQETAPTQGPSIIQKAVPGASAMESIDSRIQQAMESDKQNHSRERSGTTVGESAAAIPVNLVNLYPHFQPGKRYNVWMPIIEGENQKPNLHCVYIMKLRDAIVQIMLGIPMIYNKFVSMFIQQVTSQEPSGLATYK